MGETTDEWARKWWSRVRIPLALFFLVGMAVRNLDVFRSGEVLPIAGAVAWLGFWGWLFLRPLAPPLSETPTAEELRARNRPVVRGAAGWTVVFALLLVWSVVDRGELRTGALVAVAIPLLLLLGSWFGYAKADSIASRAAEAKARRG